MKTIQDILDKEFISQIVSLAKKRKVKIYLVGGFLRDAILDRKAKNIDLDFAVEKDAISLAKDFAKKTKSGYVILDREHGCCRVIYKEYTLDFTDFRGKDLKDDLLHRDFTINTLALELPAKKDIKKSLIDYYGAAADLDKKIVRVTSVDSFKEDHLRILRAFSLAAIFKFQIDKKTIALAKKYRDKLLEVAGERLRDELFKILDVNDTVSHIKYMDKVGVLSRVIPQIELMRSIKQGGYHHLDVWQHSIETLGQFELFLKEIELEKELKAYLEEKMAAERKRGQLLKLVCLLHDIGKPDAKLRKEGKTIFHGHERIGKDISEAISDRLKLSTKEKLAIDTMIFWHLRPGYLGDNKNITERARFRYFRDTKDEAISILLLSISDQRATRGPLADPKSRIKHEKVAFDLMGEYFKKKKEKKFVRLIGGDDLIKELKLSPSPLFKDVLQEIEEAQAEGSIKTRKEALELAKKLATEKYEN